MRPLNKTVWPVDTNGLPRRYVPAASAKLDLEGAIGSYCSYCEEFQSSLAVEHIISVDQNASLKHDWNNFLLACSRCNGADNKWNRSVSLNEMYFPHLDNTYLAFIYSEGGKVEVNPELLDEIALAKARNLMTLVGLDKVPGHPKHVPNDTRWKTRMERWDFITTVLSDFEFAGINPVAIANQAVIIGHFSIWFTLFANHPDVREALIEAFKGTAKDCFDPTNGFHPIPRPRNQA